MHQFQAIQKYLLELEGAQTDKQINQMNKHFFNVLESIKKNFKN